MGLIHTFCFIEALPDFFFSGAASSGDVDASSTTSSQVQLLASITATANANNTANEAREVLAMIEAQGKVK